MKDMDIFNMENLGTLTTKFSEKEIPILMKIFTNLMTFNSKYEPSLDERKKEANELYNFVKEISADLHTIVDGKQ